MAERKRKLEPQSNDDAATEEQPPQKQQLQFENGDEGIITTEINKKENDDDRDENQRPEEDDGEPIEDLLEPFSKEQLSILLKEAAEKHRDVADRIRIVADEDPVHRKIFVHGFAWDTKADALIKAFKQYGEIEDCKCVVDKVTGQSKGYGFILFKSRSGARGALKQPQKKIGTRMAACQLASMGPVQGGGNTVVGASSQHFNPEHVQRKIYVSNVSAEIDPQRLLEFFSRFGEVEEGPLGLDKATGRPKGFTLFVYKTAESAKKALEEPHKSFEGHVLHCHKANDGPKPVKQQHQHHQNNYNQRSRYQRNEDTGYGASGGHGHFLAGNGNNQGLNPAIGQAITAALLASQGAGVGMNQAFGQALLGTLGAPSPGAVGGMPSGYGTQANMTPEVFPGYGFQGGYQGGYQTQLPGQGGYQSQQPGQGGAGRGQHGLGYGGQYM
ncbi:UBP1-associated protein 2B [Raphanus sativus]|uniref:UBP1-associated protein 2B n=1 Tax=Raphanus sativus TaxID=3726 RepID=A0A6J0NI36_RAPSA|nr:UBP1-associated protein 2B [Raphanus sativus]XP_018483468.1 UBP1-associated protein 2B [Raphanus sativus]KAJ4904022.1 UBP1-associated protein 2B [Raphanus sativus]